MSTNGWEVQMQPGPHVIEFLASCGVRREALARLDTLSSYLEGVRAANRRLNLTRVTSPAGFWVKHVADSLAIGRVFPELLSADLRVADVGSGAGFPAVPLAWANPGLRVTAIEAREKKAKFIETEVARLGLHNCEVLAGTARQAGRLPEHAGRYDAVLFRAVGSPATLVRDSRLLLSQASGARLVFYMTPASVKDSRTVAQREAAKYKLQTVESAELELPEHGGTRQFLTLIRILGSSIGVTPTLLTFA